MQPAQFNRAEMDWARNILAQPCYTMPNGKPSHQVANEVLCRVMDRLAARGTVDAYGRWKI
jgi:hypothetical protein